MNMCFIADGLKYVPNLGLGGFKGDRKWLARTRTLKACNLPYEVTVLSVSSEPRIVKSPFLGMPARHRRQSDAREGFLWVISTAF